MTDKELLELAAVACGLIVDGVYYGTPNWNPLTYDGEALRLAVRLGLLIDVNASIAYATNGDAHAEELCEDDAFAAARRAIVRVAAEIAKAKGEA